MSKIKALYRVFTIGQSVANPQAWKKGQITAAMLASIMGAALTIAKTFGVELPLSDADLLQLGGAVIAVYGVFGAGATVASSDKVGLPPLREDRPEQQSLPTLPERTEPTLQRKSEIRNAADRI